MFWEVQRLASTDNNVGDLVLVDVAGLVALVGDESSFGPLGEAITEACKRSQRKLVWILAPWADQGPVSSVTVAQLGLPTTPLLQSREPIPSLVHEATEGFPLTRFTIVTANLEARLYEAWITGAREATMLDVATGRLWSSADFEGSPCIEPRVEAALRGATRRPQEQYRATLRHALWTDPRRWLPSLPTWWLDGFDANRHKIDLDEQRLLGRDRPDLAARQQLEHLVREAQPVPLTTAYVCAAMKRGVTRITLERILCLTPDHVWHDTSDPAEARDLLRGLHVSFPRRWFGPQILDLFVWMVREGLPLPERGIDPAWVAHLVDPEEPPDLAQASPRLLGLSPEARAWLGDLKRERKPPVSLKAVARELRPLDADLQQGTPMGVAALAEDDIGTTLPALAAIEAKGAALEVPAGFADWTSVWVHLDAAASHELHAISSLLGFSNLFTPTSLVKAIEKVLPPLPPGEKECPVEDQIQRYIEQRPALAPLGRLRALEAFTRAAPLWDVIRTGAADVRARSTLQTNGRIGLRAPALQALNRRGPQGKLIRSALRARPGHKLIGCDFNGFEARILADLSSDPVLVSAAGTSDIFLALASTLWSTPTPTPGERQLTKQALLGIAYGQRVARFWISVPGVPRQQADQLFADLEAHLPTLFAYRSSIDQAIAADPVITTRGGWRRQLHAKRLSQRQREGFNGLVQGLAADIFRRVLRELTAALLPQEAYIVHHAFDEVFVEAPEDRVQPVAALMVHVMETAASRAPALMGNVPLRVKPPRIGDTWADLI